MKIPCMTLVCVLAAARVGAAEPEVLALKVGADVWDVAVADVNGDERTDLLAVCSVNETDPLKKSLAVFLAEEGGVYGTEPSFVLPLNPEAGALFLSEVDGAPPLEVVAATAAGASVYRFEDDALKLIDEPAFGSLFPTWSKEPQFLKKTSVDLNGDGVDEWLAPTPAGYTVRTMAGELCPVRCEVDSSVRDGAGMVVTYRFPACHPFEIENHPTKALAFLTDEKASFAYGADWAERREFAIPLKLGEKWESSAMMHDIDANGMPDLVVTQTEGTINLRVLTQVFLASEHFTYPETPTATFDAKGSYAAPALKDVDGDGKLDMVFIKLPWGVRFFINLFVFRRLSVDLDVYLYADGGFASTPDFRGDVSIDAPEGREQPSYAMGDFNGDGRMDIAFGSGAEKLVVHTGSEKAFISSKPWLTLSVPAFGVARTHDLNGNEGADVVIFHPGMKDSDRIEVVIF